MYRISADTGGTFTDVVILDAAGGMTIGKALTTPERSFTGLFEAITNAAEQIGVTPESLLREADVLVYGTTRATNAIVEGTTAKTALLVTEGFRDILIYRNGGKLNANDLSIEIPPPYIPRSLTFEIRERVNAEGGVETPIDLDAARSILGGLDRLAVEAVAVCFLWSIANPIHEIAVSALLEAELPGLPYTLSSALNPVIREYPRASSTAIDASLKPMMQTHLADLKRDLYAVGFRGEVLVSASSGGVMYLDDMASRPIHMAKSGPSMAPVAGLEYARSEGLPNDVIVVDAGGTTFDVSLVRDGTIKYTRDTWFVAPLIGTLLGTAAVDVRSVGAGGGSIAWVDAGGLLRVGPRSAGSRPGPACYGRGGQDATVTDAALALGYIQPEHFLGGRMRLDTEAAVAAVGRIAATLGISSDETASAIIEISSEAMIRAIEDITINDGINPAETTIVAGGGAAGLTVLHIAASLGCSKVVIPKSAGALSAAGGQYSDIAIDFSAACVTSTAALDVKRVRSMLADLEGQAAGFAERLKPRSGGQFVRELFVEARYHGQQAELEISIPLTWAVEANDAAGLKQFFDDQYSRRYGMCRSDAEIETINWRLRCAAILARPRVVWKAKSGDRNRSHVTDAFFPGPGRVSANVYDGASLAPNQLVEGPAIVLEPTTTIVVPPGTTGRLSHLGNYLFDPVA